MKVNYSKKSNKQLDAILWKWFSLFIRMRNADDNGMVRCVTCDKRIHYKESDAGHFQTRERKSTKFDEKNVQVQCQAENRFKNGKQYEFGKAIDKIYGEGTADSLVLKSKMVCPKSFPLFIL